MGSVRKRSWIRVAGITGLLTASMAGMVQAAGEVRWGDFSASRSDRLTGASLEAGNQYVLKSSSISVGDIEALQAAQTRDATELQSLKGKLDDQARTLEELKRNSGSNSTASDSQLSDLKRTVADQKNTIDRQNSDIDGLKRSLDDLKRSVDSLSSKVK